MINKQSLWFLTLFSLILVLSVYYITMPNELLLTNNSNYLLSEETNAEGNDNNVAVTIEESELLVTMRVNLEDERNIQIADLKTTLTNETTTSEEKNSAFEQIKYLTNLKSEETALEKKIKKEFDLECFIQIDNNNIKVVAIKEKHDATLANNIMKSIQSEFENKVNITIKFEK